MIRHRLRINETMATILADERYVAVAEDEIRRQRRLIENYIKTDPAFLTSIDSRHVRADAPAIVRRMSAAGIAAGVGPMAAVAGALAEAAVMAMADAGAKHAVVDNGGDAAILAARPITVGIFTGSARIKNIGLRCEPRPAIFGVCTSSGTVGHSLSFGVADAATVVADNVCLADAAATALGNRIQSSDENHLQDSLRKMMLEGVDGLLAVVDDALAVCGSLPEIVNVRVDVDKISTSSRI